MHLLREYIARMRLLWLWLANNEEVERKKEGKIHIHETAGRACGENPRRSIKLRFNREKWNKKKKQHKIVCVHLSDSEGHWQTAVTYTAICTAKISLIDDDVCLRIGYERLRTHYILIWALICYYSNSSFVHDIKKIGKSMLNRIWFCDERNDHGLSSIKISRQRLLFHTMHIAHSINNATYVNSS